MIHEYRKHVQERAKYGLVPKSINRAQIIKLIQLLHHSSNKDDIEYLLNLFTHRILPGVDKISYIKANFLTSITNNTINSEAISKMTAIKILGTMYRGYNIPSLIRLLNDDDILASLASKALKNTLLIFDNFKNIA